MSFKHPLKAAPALDSLPFDVLDNIFLWISSPSDILSLALTSRAFPHVALDGHLRVCVLRCDISRISLWKYIQKHPERAGKIRVLGIVTESRPINCLPTIPRTLMKATLDETLPIPILLPPALQRNCLETLTNIIPLLPNLHSFAWCDKRTRHEESLLRLFTSVSHAQSIKGLLLDHVDRLHPGFGIFNQLTLFNFGIACSPLLKLSGLTEFSVSIEDTTIPVYDDILNLLVRSPGLRTLRISVCSFKFDFSPMLKDAHWPHLKTIHLTGRVHLFPPQLNLGEADVQTFCRVTRNFWIRHSHITSLIWWPTSGRHSREWGHSRFGPLQIPTTSRIRFKELEIAYGGIDLIYMPRTVIQSIGRLRIRGLVEDETVRYLLNALRGMPYLYQLTLNTWQPCFLDDLIDAIPQVIILHWSARPIYQDKYFSKLERLHSLTHLVGVLRRWTDAPGEEDDSYLQRRLFHLTRVPKLRYVSSDFDETAFESPQWVSVKRDITSGEPRFYNLGPKTIWPGL